MKQATKKELQQMVIALQSENSQLHDRLRDASNQAQLAEQAAKRDKSNRLADSLAQLMTATAHALDNLPR